MSLERLAAPTEPRLEEPGVDAVGAGRGSVGWMGQLEGQRAGAGAAPTKRPRITPVSTYARPETIASPPVVREGLVRLGHLLQVVLALDRSADPVARVHQLVGEPLRHRLLAPLPRVPDDPADGEGRGAPGPHLDRHLVRGAADAPA